VAQLREVVEAAIEADALMSNLSVTVTGSMRTHVGMGSGTAIRLAVLEALYVVNGNYQSREHLITRSRRGGTSGIGINTYFGGGLILDLGVKNDLRRFLPSSISQPKKLPTTLPSLPMPAWPLCLCIPKDIRAKSQEEELEFFERVAPLDPAASFRSAYDALFGIYAAVADADYTAFCRAINSIQDTSWKTAEWREYGAPLQQLREGLTRMGGDCVGMSSLGPMLFCLGDAATLTHIVRRQDALDCEVVLTAPINIGRKLSQFIHA
jgi:beta-ribofuranosylaminobenzene 5'-phosphate synthase